MSFYKFDRNDIFYNQIKTHPTVNFYISRNIVVYNNNTQLSGAYGNNVLSVPSGYISLYELNVDKSDELAGSLRNPSVYPFVTKQGSLTSFRTITTTAASTDFSFGDKMKGSYPLSSSISSDRFGENSTGSAAWYYRDALQNTLNNYTTLSPHFFYSSSLGDKDSQEMRIISIPSIFYGSSIKKGSVSLKFFITGTLISELNDDTSVGELKQTDTLVDTDAAAEDALKITGGTVGANEAFTVLVPESAGGLAGDVTVTVIAKATLSSPSANQIQWHLTGNDATKIANLKLAINGTSDTTKVKFGSGITNGTTVGIKGITASDGTTNAETYANLTADNAGTAGNSIAITDTVGTVLVNESALTDGKLAGGTNQSDSGSVGGVVLYNEGFIILTGSWGIAAAGSDIYYGGSATAPRWIDFAFTGTSAPQSSFQMSFSGTNYIPTLTMMTHMPKAELNYSNNPTYLKFGQSASLTPKTSTKSYEENSNISIKNIVKTNFIDPTGSFEKVTYINKVGIYDRYKNLIAIAKLATPIRKREQDEFTLKLKLDF